MKVLFFTDSHSNKADIIKVVKKAKKCDLVVCTGDISFFEHAMDLILEDLDSIGKTVIMLPGNHEDEDTLQMMCEQTKHVKYLHKNTIVIEDITFFAYGSGGFLIEDPHFDQAVLHNQREILEAKKLVLLTHQPAFNTKLDIVHKKNVGNMNIKDFILEYKPIIACSGHIHDTFGKQEKVNDTLCINPGPTGIILDV